MYNCIVIQLYSYVVRRYRVIQQPQPLLKWRERKINICCLGWNINGTVSNLKTGLFEILWTYLSPLGQKFLSLQHWIFLEESTKFANQIYLVSLIQWYLLGADENDSAGLVTTILDALFLATSGELIVMERQHLVTNHHHQITDSYGETTSCYQPPSPNNW